MSARIESTRYQKTLWNKISSDCISQYIDGLMRSMHSVSAKSLNLSQFKEVAIQMHTLHYYIAGKKPCLNTLWRVYAMFFALLRYTLPS